MNILAAGEHCSSCPAFGSSIFCTLPCHLVEHLSSEKHLHRFSAGEKPIGAGTPCTGIICLRDGNVAVTVNRDNEVSTLYVGRPGDAFGIRDWRVSAHHLRDVVGITSGSFCYIPCDVMSKLCASSSHLNLEILRQLYSRIDSVERPWT